MRGTVESVGQEGVGVVPERPSLFSTSGSSSFNPFSAALSSLRPEERAEVNRTGVSDALQRYANQEMQRLFAEHLRSFPQEPVSSSFDPFGISSRVMSAGETAQGSGVAGGTSQVFHIGAPSGSENTGSSLFQSIPSQRSSIPSHPTSSPVSFGPSTPVMSASAAPAGLLSSPGGMSDVGGTLTPPGLPLSDPPRVSGSYGIPSSDPVFGMSSGSLPCETSSKTSSSSSCSSTSSTRSWRSICTDIGWTECDESTDASDGTRDATKSYGRCWNVSTWYDGTREQSRNIEW